MVISDANESYRMQLAGVVMDSMPQLSNIKPSTWAEENIVMGKPFPGPFRYDRTPYTREIIDCLAQDHPARVVAVKKGAQVGFSSGVIMPGIGWLIKNAPGNAFVTVGHADLIEKAMEKLDLMIDGAGLRNYIKPQVQRNRAQKSGDTNFKKEFSGGYVTLASANNHKAIRQIDLQYGFFDDFESVKNSSKESGSTRKMLAQRFAAYADTRKEFYISTPELLAGSNIEEAYMLGDQRKYMVPCPCCGVAIELLWTVELKGRTAGITWKVDDACKLIPGSVGYICQACGDFFDDRRKHEMLNAGIWVPTAKPSQPGYYSYHLSSLYAPLGMYDWEHYVNDYLEANPVGQPRKEDLWKSFVNLCLGECYEESAEAPKANSIQRNTRGYQAGTVPDKLSEKDENGPILLITCAADMNGVKDDARLDYEIVGWSASGPSYSIAHGSIGTFVPRENSLRHKEDRERWTYEMGKPNSVWPVFEQVLATVFQTDTGRELRIAVAGLDTGHYTEYAYAFMDKSNHYVVGVKGMREDRYDRHDANIPLFTPSRERTGLYILQVGKFKDTLAQHMQLNWKQGEGEQPQGFMNFPAPGGGLYEYTTFFEHYEAEHRITVKNEEGDSVKSRWVKKTTTAQNHMFDCRIYNMALREIIAWELGKELKRRPFTWRDYVEMITGTG